MAVSGFFMLGTLVTLPVLVAQWIGIHGLRHVGKNGAWWSMATGAVLSTCGFVISVASPWFLHLAYGDPQILILAIAAIPALGSLLFAIGFAMHGLKASRSASRMQELEQLTAAMSEEITQLRENPPKGP